MIQPCADLDDEGTRLLTYERAHAASVEHLQQLAPLSAGIREAVSGPNVPSPVDPVVTDQPHGDLADDLTHRAALTALSGVVHRSLRDFLS